MNTPLMALTTQYILACGFAVCLAATIYMLVERSSFVTATARRMGSKSTVLAALGTVFFAATMMTAASPGTVGWMSMVGTTTPMTVGATPTMPSMFAMAIWMISLPLMCNMITTMAGCSQASSAKTSRKASQQTEGANTRMTLAAIVCVAFSFLSSSMFALGSEASGAWVTFAIALAAYAYIAMQMYSTVAEEAQSRSQPYASNYNTARNLLVLGVGAYPLVTILGMANVLSASAGLGALITALATLANFAGYSLVCLNAARAANANSTTVANDIELTVSGIATTTKATASKSKKKAA